MTWLPQETIRIKRDGGTLDAGELGRMARCIGDGTLSDAQLGAFAMAVHLRGIPSSRSSFRLLCVGLVFMFRFEFSAPIQAAFVYALGKAMASTAANFFPVTREGEEPSAISTYRIHSDPFFTFSGCEKNSFLSSPC